MLEPLEGPLDFLQLLKVVAIVDQHQVALVAQHGVGR